jgi:hypothetical protein
MISIALRLKPAARTMARPAHATDQYYGAFVLDPDGNNIEACYRGPDAG